MQSMHHLLSSLTCDRLVCKCVHVYIIFIVTCCTFYRQLSVLVDYHKQFGVRFSVLKDVMQRISDNYSMLPDDVPLWVCKTTIAFQYIVLLFTVYR